MADVGFIGFGTQRAFEMPQGDGAPVAPTGRGRFRFNRALGLVELSIDGAAYVPITTGTGSAVWEQSGTTVSLLDPAVEFVEVTLSGEQAFVPQLDVGQARVADDGGVGLVLQRNTLTRRPGDTGTTTALQLQREGGPVGGSFGIHFNAIGADPFDVHILADRQPIVLATTADWPNNTTAPIELQASAGVAGTGASEAGSRIRFRPGEGRGDGDGGNVDMEPPVGAGTGAPGEVNITVTRPSAGDQANFELPASFASISVKDNAVAQAGVTTAYTNITAWDTDGVALRASPDQANNQIGGLDPGVWEVHAQASLSASASTLLQIAVFVDGVEQDISGSENVPSADGAVSVSCVGTIVATANPSTVELHMKTDNGAGETVTVVNAQLLVRRVA